MARTFDRLRSPDQPSFSEFWTKQRRQEQENEEAAERVLTTAEIAQLEARRIGPTAATNSGDGRPAEKK